MSVRTKHCRGCGKSTKIVGLSSEDIVPKWLQPHLHIDNIQLKQTVVTESGPRLLRQLPLERFRYKGAVCETCNNGWMSDLEKEAKPILLPLVEGSRHVSSLGEAERLSIARWAFKTAFMILGAQSSYPPPWAFFEQWALTGAKGPNPAFILGLSNPSLTSGFGFSIREDVWEDGDRATIRVGFGMRSLFLVVALPATGSQHGIGVASDCFHLLFPRAKLRPRPVPPHAARMDYQSYIDHLTNLVICGLKTEDTVL
jgi:hypothetical protein